MVRFRNNAIDAIRPISIAIVKSKITVNKNVTMRTAKSDFGFFANIQLLSRKPSAMPAARVLIAFKIIHLLWYLLLNGVAVLIAQDPMVRVVIGGITLLMLAARITLLVFYWIAVARAGHYFAGRKRLLGF